MFLFQSFVCSLSKIVLLLSQLLSHDKELRGIICDLQSQTQFMRSVLSPRLAGTCLDFLSRQSKQELCKLSYVGLAYSIWLHAALSLEKLLVGVQLVEAPYHHVKKKGEMAI